MQPILSVMISWEYISEFLQSTCHSSLIAFPNAAAVPERLCRSFHSGNCRKRLSRVGAALTFAKIEAAMFLVAIMLISPDKLHHVHFVLEVR